MKTYIARRMNAPDAPVPGVTDVHFGTPRAALLAIAAEALPGDSWLVCKLDPDGSEINIAGLSFLDLAAVPVARPEEPR